MYYGNCYVIPPACVPPAVKPGCGMPFDPCRFPSGAAEFATTPAVESGCGTPVPFDPCSTIFPISQRQKSAGPLKEFVKYCNENPGLRFWQALRSWSGWNCVLVTNDPYYIYSDVKHLIYDTFYWSS